MNYDDFTVQILNQLRDEMGKDYSVTINKVVKNNGFELDGLVMMKNGENISPTVYLEYYFQQLKNGMKMDEIVDEICSIYTSSHENIYKFLADAKDFEKVKGKIVYKLIRRQGNEALLSDVPFMPYLDLAVVYYLLLEVNKLGQITALIHNEHLILWNINLELLHHAAEANTIKLLPSSVQPIWDIVSDIVEKNMKNGNDAIAFHEQLKEDEDTINHPLFVLSNTLGVQGAVCILYEHVLKDISDKWGSDILILPSSVHETLLLPYEQEVDLEDFQVMVKSINSSMVAGEEVLSDHIYIYKREDDRIIIAV